MIERYKKSIIEMVECIDDDTYLKLIYKYVSYFYKKGIKIRKKTRD